MVYSAEDDVTGITCQAPSSGFFLPVNQGNNDPKVRAHYSSTRRSSTSGPRPAKGSTAHHSTSLMDPLGVSVATPRFDRHEVGS